MLRLSILTLFCLAVRVSASFWSRLSGQHALAIPQKSTVSKSFYLELEELSRLVDITYCLGIQGAGIKRPFSCPSHCKDFPHVELVTAWNTGPLLSDSCGYIALDHGSKHSLTPPRILVAFRGTYSLANTVYDLSTIPQEYIPYPDDAGDGKNPNATKCDSCSVHTGFYTSWKNTRKVILPEIERTMKEFPKYKLELVGHSLGGAVAALAALELSARGRDPRVTTFGEPRIGNQALANFVDTRFSLHQNKTLDPLSASEKFKFRRLTHVGDPVPHLPLQEWGYRPHSGEIYISKIDTPPEIADLRICQGQQDKHCSVGPQSDWSHFPWGIPARYKIWELFWAHRDYFWRLGLCLGHEHDRKGLEGTSWEF
jgi:pimeloyl-ACP methyl ester carboxylesterase